jgi:hypothetical protein
VRTASRPVVARGGRMLPFAVTERIPFIAASIGHIIINI